MILLYRESDPAGVRWAYIIQDRQKWRKKRLTMAKEALLLPLPRYMACGVAEQ